MRKRIVSAIKREKIFLFMLIQCQIISILLCRGLSKLIINGKSGRNMEAVLLYTTQVMPALKPVNFLSVKNMLEEGLLGHDHITLNTTAYYATKQQIDNRKFQFMSRRQSYYINYRSSRKRKKVLSQLEIKGHL